MGSSRKTANRSPKHQHRSFSSQQLIQDLLSSLHPSQNLKLPVLKSLYCLLVHLSLDSAICDARSGTSSSFRNIRIDQYGTVPFAEICSLSDILFKELFEMFKNLVSALHHVSANLGSEPASLQLDICATAQRLNLMLRCCMVMLKLLVLDQHRLLEQGQVLHSILAKLCSLSLNRGNEEITVTFEKVSQEYTDNDTYSASCTEDFVASLQFMEPIDHCLHFLCAILEVFLDELLVHGQLRECFKLIDFCSTSSKLFMSHPNHGGDIGSVIEVICTHFCISFSDVQTLESFGDKLFGFRRANFRVPELSPVAAVVLLLNPLMFTAPKFLQAHLISLVAESITSDMGFQNDKPDVRLMDCYLSAFERSVILYIKHMSTFEMNFCPTSGGDFDHKDSAYEQSSQPSFEFYLRPATRKKLDDITSELANSLQLQLEHRCLRSKADLVSSSIAHMWESKNILDTSFRDEIISISGSIISNVCSDEIVGVAFHSTGDASPESLYLLASILKLMSCSLLQAIWCLMYNGDFGCLRTLKDLSSCKEYKFMTEIISCFQHFNISLPIQKSLRTVMETYPEKHKESKLMLLHFSGLLSLCFSTGLDFLIKSCISTMITLMNLFVFEEGNLDTLRVEDMPEIFTSGFPQDNGQEAMADKRSSLIIASKFQKIHALYQSVPSFASGIESGKAANSVVSNDKLHCLIGMEEKTEETINGKFFLKCVTGNQGKPHDFDDLADFVECKSGKNYSSWLKQRERYRKRKCEKLALIRWKRKKTTWKYIQGRKTS